MFSKQNVCISWNKLKHNADARTLNVLSSNEICCLYILRLSLFIKLEMCLSFCFLCCILFKNVIFVEAAEKESIIIVCKSHVYFKMKIKQLIKPLVLILSQIYLVHALSYFLKIQFKIIYPLCLGLLSGPFPSGFAFETWNAFLFSLLCATYPAHIMLLDETH